MGHSPGPVNYECKTCGWVGAVKSRPRCLACANRRTRAWRKANPDKARADKRRQERRFRTERRDEYNAKRRQKRNGALSAAAVRRRKMWLTAGDVTAAQLRAIYERDGGCCRYCRQIVYPRFNALDPRGFDHVVPRAKGGQHTASNIVTCCGICNAAKSSALLDELKKAGV